MHAAAGKNIQHISCLSWYVREQWVNFKRAALYKNVYKYSQRKKSWDGRRVKMFVAVGESKSEFNTLHKMQSTEKSSRILKRHLPFLLHKEHFSTFATNCILLTFIARTTWMESVLYVKLQQSFSGSLQQTTPRNLKKDGCFLVVACTKVGCYFS